MEFHWNVVVNTTSFYNPRFRECRRDGTFDEVVVERVDSVGIRSVRMAVLGKMSVVAWYYIDFS
jgi:hypothetical protein